MKLSINFNESLLHGNNICLLIILTYNTNTNLLKEAKNVNKISQQKYLKIR